jgi:hypothetical protein
MSFELEEDDSEGGAPGVLPDGHWRPTPRTNRSGAPGTGTSGSHLRPTPATGENEEENEDDWGGDASV